MGDVWGKSLVGLTSLMKQPTAEVEASVVLVRALVLFADALLICDVPKVGYEYGITDIDVEQLHSEWCCAVPMQR